MKLLGVVIKHPSPPALGLAVFLILSFLSICLFLGKSADGLFPSLAAFSGGVIAAAFGISPAKGWRPCVLLLGISLVLYVIVGLLTGKPAA